MRLGRKVSMKMLQRNGNRLKVFHEFQFFRRIIQYSLKKHTKDRMHNNYDKFMVTIYSQLINKINYIHNKHRKRQKSSITPKTRKRLLK